MKDISWRIPVPDNFPCIQNPLIAGTYPLSKIPKYIRVEDNMDMTVKEAQELKEKVEDMFEEVIMKFKKKTGLTITAVNLKEKWMSDEAGTVDIQILQKVEIKTEL